MLCGHLGGVEVHAEAERSAPSERGLKAHPGVSRKDARHPISSCSKGIRTTEMSLPFRPSPGAFGAIARVVNGLMLRDAVYAAGTSCRRRACLLLPSGVLRRTSPFCSMSILTGCRITFFSS